MRDRHSTDVATAARLAFDDMRGHDQPSPDEYVEDREPPRVFPRCPATEAETGFAFQCALPECQAGACMRAEAVRPAVRDAVA